MLLSQNLEISQMDMVSIFYRLMSFINNNFFSMVSLRPKYILVKESITISSILCINPYDVNVSYLAPEELDPELQPQDVELINFWKIGMLLYEIAYKILPFPIEYLAYCVNYHKSLALKFPLTQRSYSLQQFIRSILQINPGKRGGGIGWKKKVFFIISQVFQHLWLQQNMR